MPFPSVLPGPLLFLPETQHHLLQAASHVSLPHTHEMGWHPSLPSTPSPTILPPPQSPPLPCGLFLHPLPPSPDFQFLGTGKSWGKTSRERAEVVGLGEERDAPEVRHFRHGCKQKRRAGFLSERSFKTQHTCALFPQGCQPPPRQLGFATPLPKVLPSDHPPSQAPQTLGASPLPLPPADLSEDEQSGRRAMKVVRVLSVSPTFHKLELVGRAETRPELTASPALQPHASSSPTPHLSTSPGSPAPSGLSPKPPRAPSPTPPHGPSLDSLQLAQRGQTFREDTQHPLLHPPTCGRKRCGGGAPQALGRSGTAGRGARGGGSPRM